MAKPKKNKKKNKKAKKAKKAKPKAKKAKKKAKPGKSKKAKKSAAAKKAAKTRAENEAKRSRSAKKAAKTRKANKAHGKKPKKAKKKTKAKKNPAKKKAAKKKKCPPREGTKSYQRELARRVAKNQERETKREAALKRKNARKDKEIAELEKKLHARKMAAESPKKKKHKKKHKKAKRNPVGVTPSMNPVGSSGMLEFAAGFGGVVAGGLLALVTDRWATTKALTASAGTDMNGNAITQYTDAPGVGQVYNSQGANTPIWSSWKRMAADAAAILVPLGISAAIPDKHPNLKTFTQLGFFGALTVTGVKLFTDLGAKLLGSTSTGARLFAPESAATSQLAAQSATALSSITTSPQTGKLQAASATAMMSGTPKAPPQRQIASAPSDNGMVASNAPAGRTMQPKPTSESWLVLGGSAGAWRSASASHANNGQAPNTPISTGAFPPPNQSNTLPPAISLPQCDSCGSYACDGASGGTCPSDTFDPLDPEGAMAKDPSDITVT